VDVLAAAVVVPLKIALYMWLPIAGMILRFAIPPNNCAFLKIAASSHKDTAASQKVTVPTDRAGLPVTEALSVTSDGEASDDEESVRVVVVGNGAACEVAAEVHATTVNKAGSNSLEMKRREDAIRLQAVEDPFHIQTILGSHFIQSGRHTSSEKLPAGPGEVHSVTKHERRIDTESGVTLTISVTCPVNLLSQPLTRRRQSARSVGYSS
jgi:hypothetical protein